MSKTSLLVKAAVSATMVALVFSSVAFAKGRTGKAPAAKAASGTPSAMSTQVMQSSWKEELAWFKFDTAVLGRFDRALEGLAHRFDKGFGGKHPDQLASGNLDRTVREVDALLSKAQAIVTAHAGFDASGTVTDQAQALKSVQTLGSILEQLRATLIYRLEHVL